MLFSGLDARAAAGINPQFNYQGRLTNSSGANVSDGAYNFVFKLYTASSGGSAIWTETWNTTTRFSSTVTGTPPTSGGTSVTYVNDTTESYLAIGDILYNTTANDEVIIESFDAGANTITISPTSKAWSSSDAITTRIYVRSGLFSSRLGSITSLSSINLNQTPLYLGVAVGADSEMTPRKRITSVLQSFQANKLDGYLTSTSTTAASEYGSTLTISDTGIVTTGTDATYGLNISTARTGATGGTINTYGLYSAVTADNAGAGTSTAVGGYFSATGADNNYGLIVENGNVGIGTTAPNEALTINGSISVQELSSSPSATSGYGKIYALSTVGAGNDVYTKLLLQSDGTGASFTDSSSGAKTVTANGNATQSATQSKFGGKSGYFDGTGDYLSLADSADWDFGNGAYSIDFWVKFNSVSGDITFYEQYANSTNYIRFTSCYGCSVASTRTLTIYARDTSDAYAHTYIAWTPATATWYHLAVTREAATTQAKLFIDGIMQSVSHGSITSSVIPNYAAPITIGARSDGTNPLDGYIDELRISKGIARWTSTFTPPTSPYSETNLFYKTGDGQEINLSTGDGVWIDDGTSVRLSTNTDNVGIGTSTPGTYTKLNVSQADATASQTRYGLYSTATGAGATSTNIAGYFSATGATNNYAAIFENGSVGIGTTTPAASSLLDITSTAKGFLAPRMTTTERDAISSPAAGLMIYNSTTNQYNVYNGTSWGAVGGSSQWTTSASDIYYTTGSVGIGTTSPNNRLEVLSTTTPQLRVAYDTSNYATIAAASNGAVTFDATGAGAAFSFSDAASFPAGATITCTDCITDANVVNTITASNYLPLAGGTLIGNLLFSADNTYDIGASGATRARTGYFGTSVVVGSTTTITTNAVNFSSAATMSLASVTNALNIDSDTLVVDALNDRVGIGTTTPTQKLTVVGTIESTSGGFKFPDGTTQTTAAAAAAAAPSFSVHKNGTDQTVTFDTTTKVTWSVEEWDTNNNFASDKFTPTVAGKYLFIISVRWANASDQGVEDIYLYKNGVYKFGTRLSTSGTNPNSTIITVLADANGSTDYFEAFVTNTSTGARNILGAAESTYFQGHKLPTTEGGGGGWTDDGTVVRLSTNTDNVGIGTSTPGSYTKLNVSQADATASQTRYGLYSTATGAGATSTNIAGYFSATGATNNYAAIFENGNVGIGTTAPEYNLDVNGTFRTKVVASATGGTVTYSGGYTIHTFISGGTFTPNGAGNVEYLVVGGGGAGGSTNGGAGGAGGVKTGTLAVSAQAYSITVGTGGVSADASGTGSIFSSISVSGGGGGNQSTTPSTGGSGGGAGGNGDDGTPPGAAGIGGEGSAGGAGYASSGNRAGGGGGGKGGIGVSATAGVGGNGGVGIASSISGSAVYYGGGGGGGTQINNSANRGVGGNGGGGDGGYDTTNATAGTANTGGGGGGGGGGSTYGAGGSGIVIIRYPTSWGTIDGLVVNSTGNVGIGTATPTYQLQLSTDSAAKPTSNTWTIASDARIKTDITDFKEGLATVLAISPRVYKYNGAGGLGYNDENTHIGVIAQELEPIAPYMVETGKGVIDGVEVDDFKFYQGHALSFVLVNAIKELDAKINEFSAALAGDKPPRLGGGQAAASGNPVSGGNGVSTEYWLINSSGRLTSTVDLDLGGKSIHNIGSLFSASGKWKLDENGKLIIEDIEVSKIKVKEQIIMIDKNTGEKYCISIKDGEWLKEKCDIETQPNEQMPEDNQSILPEGQPAQEEPADQQSSDTNLEAEPLSEPQPEPEPETDIQPEEQPSDTNVEAELLNEPAPELE